MRRKIIAGNWKMNKTPKEAFQLIETLRREVINEQVDVVFCPPYISLTIASDALKGTDIALGAQNMFYEDRGAYTGEISPEMLLEVGVKYVIIGHSERRVHLGETNEMVNKKVLKAIEYNLTPIICVGESLAQREQGITLEYIRTQTKAALEGVSREDARGLVFAYEPLWAIGTGKTATAGQAEEVCAAIRGFISNLYDQDVADEIRIQYGGSVNGSNAKELFNQDNIDGGLIGGASLNEEFIKIVQYNQY